MKALLLASSVLLAPYSIGVGAAAADGIPKCSESQGDTCTAEAQQPESPHASHGMAMIQARKLVQSKKQNSQQKKMLWQARKQIAKQDGLLQTFKETEGARKPADNFLPLCDPTVVEETCRDLNDGIDDDIPEGYVSAEVLQEELSSCKSSIATLWKVLELKDGKAAHCKNLCTKAVEYLGKFAALPETSDRACYTLHDGSVKCDVDVSPDALASVEMKGDLPDAHDSDFLNKTALLQRPFPRFERRKSEDIPSMIEGESVESSHGPKGGKGRRDSGDYYNYQDYSDNTESAAIEYTEYELVQRVANFFRVFPVGDPAEDAGISFIYSTSTVSNELRACRDKISAVNAKSKAWVGSVIDKVSKHQTEPLMNKWFGRKTSETRSEVTRVLNVIDNMLGTVEYVLPGDQCSPNTYGYVYPQGSSCCNGNHKVIYLCQLFCDSEESVQIETITHEGAHHGSAYLDDVQPDPYGRSRCEQIAEQNPDDALKNADNFCYYIADVALNADSDDGGDGCRYANDGECDETQYCQSGTDTTDCKDVPTPQPPPTPQPTPVPPPPPPSDNCQWANDGVCDVPRYCPAGSDVADCAGGCPSRDASCKWANDGECDEPSYCDECTDGSDCR